MNAVVEKRGGLLLRVFLGVGEPMSRERGEEEAYPTGAALGFIPADVAGRLTQLSSLTHVPGAELPIVGLALAEGAVVTVLQIGSPSSAGAADGDARRAAPGADRAVLCHLGNVDVALTGGVVVATGLFEAEPDGDGVVYDDRIVRLLDVRALYAQAEAETWAPHARGPRDGSMPSIDERPADAGGAGARGETGSRP